MGSTETGLERIRTRLLDLTNRNKLLNFRHSAASTLRVVEVNLNSVFRRVMDGEKLRFIPVPEPDDLGQTPTPHGSLPVLHYRQPLDTLTRKPEHQVEHVGSDALNRCNDETSRLSPVFRHPGLINGDSRATPADSLHTTCVFFHAVKRPISRAASCSRPQSLPNRADPVRLSA